jgi:hypothetical protein
VLETLLLYLFSTINVNIYVLPAAMQTPSYSYSDIPDLSLMEGGYDKSSYPITCKCQTKVLPIVSRPRERTLCLTKVRF